MKSLARLLAALLLMVALAGCSGDEPADEPDDAMDGPDDAMDGDEPTTPAPTADEEPEMLPVKYLNGTITDLASCTVVSAAVGSGAPIDPLAQTSSESLEETDANRSYSISLVADAFAPAGASFPLASLCVGFDGVSSLGGASGTIPPGATAMLIGGDFVFSGAYSVRIE